MRVRALSGKYDAMNGRTLCGQFWCAAALLVLTMGWGRCADYWASSTEPGIATSNDCGRVTSVSGKSVVRRSYMTDKDSPLALYAADRLYSGDAIEVAADGLVEWTTGDNLIIVLGPDAAARLEGLRRFADAGGKEVARLDVQLVRGELRAQVRLNENHPESLLVGMSGGEALATRGDVAAYSNNNWRVVALKSQLAARQRRGGAVGAPFTVPDGGAAGGSGEERLDARGLVAIRDRLPFSFESKSTALPPRPLPNGEVLGP